MEKLDTALISGLVSLLVSLLVQLTGWFLVPLIKRWWITRKLEINVADNHGGATYCRVMNNTFSHIKNAAAYITLDVRLEDYLDPPENCAAFITPSNPAAIDEQQLCWAVCAPTINPIRVDICANEQQPLSLCAIENNAIILSSEDWPATARAYLRNRKYNGTLKIVSEDTNARTFKISIDFKNTIRSLTLSK